MINTLKNLFGLGPKVDYADLVKQGAIIDVRSEYKQGHIKVHFHWMIFRNILQN
jgi:hypothetical protein